MPSVRIENKELWIENEDFVGLNGTLLNSKALISMSKKFFLN